MSVPFGCCHALFHRGRVFETSHDAIELASGARLELDVIHHLGGAAVLPLFENDDVVLIRQYRHPAGQVLLEAPAGRLEPGEAPAAAAHRELREETGYQASTLTFVTKFYALPGYSTEILYCFLATGLTPGPQSLDTDEDIRTIRLPFAEARNLVYQGHRGCQNHDDHPACGCHAPRTDGFSGQSSTGPALKRRYTGQMSPRTGEILHPGHGNDLPS